MNFLFVYTCILQYLMTCSHCHAYLQNQGRHWLNPLITQTIMQHIFRDQSSEMAVALFTPALTCMCHIEGPPAQLTSSQKWFSWVEYTWNTLCFKAKWSLRSMWRRILMPGMNWRTWSCLLVIGSQNTQCCAGSRQGILTATVVYLVTNFSTLQRNKEKVSSIPVL